MGNSFGNLFSSRLDNDFSNIEYIERGAFGDVYKAKHRRDGKLYAIKRIYVQEADSEIEIEVKHLAMLNHKNVIRYHSCWVESLTSLDKPGTTAPNEENKSLFIQMELCATLTLQTVIEEAELSLSLKWAMYKQLIDGLNYIHKNNVVHGDLKADNIFISGGILKIGDFGLSKYKNTDGEKEDIFSLGVMVFDIFTGPRVSERTKCLKILGGISESESESESENESERIIEKLKLGYSQRRLLEKLLHKNPQERPTTAALLNMKDRCGIYIWEKKDGFIEGIANCQ